jgi:multimeric flavodoxin WrbA
MKIAAIVGSPRKNGQSAQLVNAILDGAKKSGAEVAIHYLGEKTILPCTGCYSCKETKECIIKNDDMMDIYEDMETADAYVFASPVYFKQVSGQFKVFIDRIFPYYWDKPMTGKKGVFTLVCNNGNESLYHEVVNWFTDMITSDFGIECVDTVKVHDVGKHPVVENNELMERAREIGKKLV